MIRKALTMCAFCAGFAVCVAGVDDHTLFYCSFDQKLKADFAVGATSLKGQAAITKNKGGKVGEALIVRNAECVSPFEVKGPYKFLQALPKGNYNTKTGTVEMWVKMGEPKKTNMPKSELYTVLLLLARSDNFGQKAEWMTLRLVYNHWSSIKAKWYLEFEINDKDAPREFKGADWVKNHLRACRYKFPIESWTEKEWHHVALTWNKKQFQLFIDGKLVNSMNTRFDGILKEAANQLFIGGNYGTGNYALPCLIDELQISDNVRYENDFIPGK
jgi:hypothetical protein